MNVIKDEIKVRYERLYTVANTVDGKCLDVENLFSGITHDIRHVILEAEYREEVRHMVWQVEDDAKGLIYKVDNFIRELSWMGKELRDAAEYYKYTEDRISRELEKISGFEFTDSVESNKSLAFQRTNSFGYSNSAIPYLWNIVDPIRSAIASEYGAESVFAVEISYNLVAKQKSVEYISLPEKKDKIEDPKLSNALIKAITGYDSIVSYVSGAGDEAIKYVAMKRYHKLPTNSSSFKESWKKLEDIACEADDISRLSNKAKFIGKWGGAAASVVSGTMDVYSDLRNPDFDAEDKAKAVFIDIASTGASIAGGIAIAVFLPASFPVVGAIAIGVGVSAAINIVSATAKKRWIDENG